MKNRLLTSLAILFISLIMNTKGQAQNNYKTAIGLRLNEGMGITARHFLNSKNSIEGIIYTRWEGGVNLTGLYQVNYPVFNEPGFNFYMGGGAHIGFWGDKHDPWWDEDHDYDGGVVLGVDGQVGLEYTFEKIPLNLALDWKPSFSFIGVTDFWVSDLGFSVRYAIK